MRGRVRRERERRQCERRGDSVRREERSRFVRMLRAQPFPTMRPDVSPVMGVLARIFKAPSTPTVL